jgi:hypothetical protein
MVESAVGATVGTSVEVAVGLYDGKVEDGLLVGVRVGYVEGDNVGSTDGLNVLEYVGL